MIWELRHTEYLEEKAAKNASAAAGTSSDGNGIKPSKEKNQRRVGDGGSSHTAAAAADKRKTMKNKTLSSRINYDVLSQMSGDGKQQTTEIDTGALTEEQEDKNSKEFHREAIEDYNEAEKYGEDKLDAAEYDDYVGGEEDYGDGEYNEYFADGNEDYADDDFGF